MIKQVHRLMLSAALFTTGPLLAMEPEQGKEEKKIHISTICNHELKSCTAKEIVNGKGLLNDLHTNDMIIEVIHRLPYNDFPALSCASKVMNILCHSPVVWEHIAQNSKIQLDNSLCKICQVKKHYTLFSDKNKEYTITLPTLPSFKQIPETTNYEDWENNPYLRTEIITALKSDLPCSYSSWSFFLGNRKHQIFCNESDHDLNKFINEKEPISFTWKEKVVLYPASPCFHASIHSIWTFGDRLWPIEISIKEVEKNNINIPSVVDVSSLIEPDLDASREK